METKKVRMLRELLENLGCEEFSIFKSGEEAVATGIRVSKQLLITLQDHKEVLLVSQEAYLWKGYVARLSITTDLNHGKVSLKKKRSPRK